MLKLDEEKSTDASSADEMKWILYSYGEYKK
jgi:hypothetical protein